MAEAKRRDDWAYRACLLSLTWNAHFKPRMSPADFNPMTSRGGRKAVVKVSAERAIRMLQRMVLSRRRREEK